MSFPAASWSVLAGFAAGGLAWSAFSLIRELAVWNWVGGKASRQSPGGLILIMAGEVQEKLPGVRRFSGWLLRQPAKWGGEPGESSAANLARREMLLAGGFLLFYWLAGSAAIGLAGGAGAFLIPDLASRTRRERRQAAIRRELPDVLGLVALGAESGLSLDAGLRQVAEKMPHCTISSEIGRMLGEIRFGARRHQAWRDMARRTGSPEMKEVVEALVQADLMGTGLKGSLRGLAEQARIRHRQHLEEQAAKAPVKLIFPLVFCIFPAVFVVLLGPVFLALAGAIG